VSPAAGSDEMQKGGSVEVVCGLVEEEMVRGGKGATAGAQPHLKRV
jgi:hypothetical protein